MKSPEEAKQALVDEWLRKAEDDIRVIDLLNREDPQLVNPMAFHAQQAVEKLLKAVLTWHQIPFPKTHDIERLLVLVASAAPELADGLSEASMLTVYGVESRYPGDYPVASRQVCEAAVGLVYKAREMACAALARGRRKT